MAEREAEVCECGGSWANVEHGSQLIRVCESCGSCRENVVYDARELPSHRGVSEGTLVTGGGAPTRQGKYHARRDPAKFTETRFVSYVRKAAKKAQLNREGTEICIAEAKSLLTHKEDVVGRMEKIATGIVFLEVKRTTPTLSFQYFSAELGIKTQVLGNAVKTIKLIRAKANLNQEDQDASSTTRVPFERRLENVFDRLDVSLVPEKRKEIKELAKDLKQLCSDVPLNGCVLLDNESSDFAFYALASVHVQNLEEKAVVEEIAKKIEMNPGTLRNRVLRIRSILLALAKKIPSMDILTDVTIRNISRYIPVIVRNKSFLTKGPERFYTADSAVEQEGVPLSSSQPGSSTWKGWEEGEEDEGTLSDLDPEIDQYIASEKEVRKKRKFSCSDK